MKKVDKRELDGIIWKFNSLVDELRKFNTLSENGKKYFLDLLSQELTPNELNQIFFKTAKNAYYKNADMVINYQDALCLDNIYLALQAFFSTGGKSCTLDEMEEKYANVVQMFKEKRFSNNLHYTLDLMKSYIDFQKMYVGKVLNAYKISNLSSVLDDLSYEEIEGIQLILGFRKKLTFVFSNDYKKIEEVSEDYFFDLTSEEENLDIFITNYIEKRKRIDEKEDGISLWYEINSEVSSYIKYSYYIKNLITCKMIELDRYGKKKNKQIEQLNNEVTLLQKLYDKIWPTFKIMESFKNELIQIVNLDQLRQFRDHLSNNSFWLKNAINKVIYKMNNRIQEFNNLVDENLYQDELQQMTLWQKRCFYVLRDSNNNDMELQNFTVEAREVLYDSIMIDEQKEANEHGFDNFEEYMISLYKDKMNKGIVNYGDIEIFNIYRQLHNKK